MAVLLCYDWHDRSMDLSPERSIILVMQMKMRRNMEQSFMARYPSFRLLVASYDRQG